MLVVMSLALLLGLTGSALVFLKGRSRPRVGSRGDERAVCVREEAVRGVPGSWFLVRCCGGACSVATQVPRADRGPECGRRSPLRRRDRNDPGTVGGTPFDCAQGWDSASHIEEDMEEDRRPETLDLRPGPHPATGIQHPGSAPATTDQEPRTWNPKP